LAPKKFEIAVEMLAENLVNKKFLSPLDKDDPSYRNLVETWPRVRDETAGLLVRHYREQHNLSDMGTPRPPLDRNAWEEEFHLCNLPGHHEDDCKQRLVDGDTQVTFLTKAPIFSAEHINKWRETKKDASQRQSKKPTDADLLRLRAAGMSPEATRLRTLLVGALTKKIIPLFNDKFRSGKGRTTSYKASFHNRPKAEGHARALMYAAWKTAIENPDRRAHDGGRARSEAPRRSPLRLGKAWRTRWCGWSTPPT
jgi:hypothetical protein